MTDDTPIEQRVRRVQSAAATANKHTARAVDAASEMADREHPGPAVRNTADELRKAYAETRRAVERAYIEQAGLEDGDGRPDTPRGVTEAHAERLEEQYDGPVLNLALQLLERNRREWLYADPESNGAQAVRDHGLTGNQRKWLNDLQDAWGAYDE